jgi:electron-transferring-flavoprotein dehydrogenase
MGMESVKRERFQADVVVVGGGPAGLATALRLLKRVADHNASVESGSLQAAVMEMPHVMVIEKGTEPGNHTLSGAVVDPISLKELIPDFMERNAPFEGDVRHNPFYLLTSRAAVRIPVTPPGMGSKGCLLTSLSRLTRWLSKEAEGMGVQIFSGFTAVDFLRDGSAVKGIRLGDKGIDKHGQPRHNALFGDEIEAKVTVLAEGVSGSLTKRAVRDFGLGGTAMPQANVLGIKEIIQLPVERLKPGTAMHTFGHPLDTATYGGGFIYSRPDRHVAIGLAIGLDYRDPRLDLHDEFNRWKSHPFMKKLLAGGKVVEYGAKTIPEGGWFCIPGLVADGLAIVGDGAGLLNSVRLKGIHLALQSGIDAADAIFECLKSSAFGKDRLGAYPEKFLGGWAGKELFRVRNLHQCFHRGQYAYMAGIALHTASLGALPGGKLAIHPEAESLQPLSPKKRGPEPFAFTQDALMLDKLSDVFLSGTVHEEDQPSHITIKDRPTCLEKCKAEFGCPCTRFCPAQVYEWIEEEKQIRVNFTNCLHCQTCETKDPYRNIEWKLPEGDGGPKYKNM